MLRERITTDWKFALTHSANERTRLHFLQTPPVPSAPISSPSTDAETEAQKKIKSLMNINHELQSMNSMSSHDLGTLLLEIQFTVKQLERQIGTECHEKEENKKSFNQIYNSVTAMKALLKDLLFYSGISEYEEKSMKVLNLNLVIAGVLDDLKTSLRQKAVAVEVGKLPWLKAHDFHMRELFQNLISNAVKYCAPEGQREIEISSLVTEEWVDFLVWDNGIGFEAENSKAIFEPFRRLHAQAAEGTGLGLSICQKIARYYGGEIIASCEPGKGTTFCIRLPYRPDLIFIP